MQLAGAGAGVFLEEASKQLKTSKIRDLYKQNE